MTDGGRETGTGASLPAAYRPETLVRNLAALERRDPALAARLRLPVDGERVHFAADGGATYAVHRARLPLAVAPEAVAELLVGTAGAGRALVLGVGLGELPDALLAAGVGTLVVWDRDPWLLRLWLLSRDLVQPLSAGRLRLALGTDLLRLPRVPQRVVEHPLFRAVYRDELRVFHEGLRDRRALLVTGGVLVDQVQRALERRGWSVWPLEATRFAAEELETTARALAPELVLAVNLVDGLADFCRELGLPLIVWEVDPTATRPRAPRAPTDHVTLFSWRARDVALFRRLGFARSFHLPLAADPEVRRPLEPGETELPEPAAVSFVGSSLVADAERLRGEFVAHVARVRGGGAEAERGARALAAEILAEQERDLERYLVPEILRARAPDLAGEEAGAPDLAVLLGESAASRRRLERIGGLAALGASVWGDPGWRALEPRGVRWRGWALHGDPLTRIYAASAINLDVGRLYQRDIVTMRVFDVLACGRFVLAERSPALEELFEPGVEVGAWSSPEELATETRRWLERPDEAAALARCGRAAVLARHTIDRRLEAMLAVAGGASEEDLRRSWARPGAASGSGRDQHA